MITKVEITRDRRSLHIGRYPWERLAEPGDRLTLFGRTMSVDGAIQSARLYAVRRGWVVRANKIGFVKGEGWTVDFARIS